MASRHRAAIVAGLGLATALAAGGAYLALRATGGGSGPAAAAGENAAAGGDPATAQAEARTSAEAAAAAERRTKMPPAGEGVARSASGASNTAVMSSAPGAPAAGGDEPPTALAGPSESEIAGETADNPHVTPAALIDFSHRVAGLMVQARQDEKAARAAFARLEDCAADAGGAQVPQARVLCIANAHQLAIQFPASLGERYAALARKAPEIAQLARMTGIDD